MKNKRTPDLFSTVLPFITEIFQNKKEISRIELAIAIGQKINRDIKEIIPTIDHLIYHDFFLLDFETKIDDYTILRIKGDNSSVLKPIYQFLREIYDQNQLVKEENKPKFVPVEKDPTKDEKYKGEYQSLSKKMRKRIHQRLELLKIFDQPNLTTEKLDEFA
jgi:hypothetical protein